MSPNFIFNNFRNGLATNWKHFGKCMHRYIGVVKFSNFLYLKFIEFSSAMLYTKRMFRSPFFFHISHVICMSTKKKMFRIYTNWIITFMKNLVSGRNGSNMKKIRESMRQPGSALKADISISRARNSSNPEPATLTFLDFLVESTSGRFQIKSLISTPF